MKKRVTVLSLGVMHSALCLLGALLLVFSFRADAQQPAKKIFRLGILTVGIAPSIGAFLQSLQELGWVEGQNIAIVYRSADGNEERLSVVASQLVQANVDIIVSTSFRGTVAARQVTKNVPIVTTTFGDRVINLDDPEANITGVSVMPRELGGKRLELLNEIIPKISRVAVLSNIIGSNAAQEPSIKNIDAVARSLGVQMQILNVTKPEEIENAFASMARGKADTLLVTTSAMFTLNRARIVKLAAKSRLPAMYPNSNFADAGGLMSYGQNDVERYHRAAYFVDRILKGAKPSDLPVEQPTKFEFVINLKAAEEIGLRIPPEVLMWADRVIK
jgi:putative ABC transport system substrate-binding protein